MANNLKKYWQISTNLLFKTVHNFFMTCSVLETVMDRAIFQKRSLLQDTVVLTKHTCQKYISVEKAQ